MVKLRTNPSFRKLARPRTPPGVLRAAIRNRGKRNTKLKQLGGVSKIPTDFGTCWMCWMELTGKDLDHWREDYSIRENHSEICPLCDYDRWKGRIWYPFQYLENEMIGNPSRRDNALTDREEI